MTPEPMPPPPASDADAAVPSSVSLDDVAANCGSANTVYADVLDATGTGVAGGPRLFPVSAAYSSSVGTSTTYVELTTFNGEGPNGIAVMVGNMSSAATPLAIQPYVEPPTDSPGAPFVTLVIDGRNLMGEGRACGHFAITALASDSSEGVLLPFSITFDVTIATAAWPAHVVGCGHWNG